MNADTDDTIDCWRSKDGGHWCLITVGAHSLVGHRLALIEPGQIYDDGYGNRYMIDIRQEAKP